MVASLQTAIKANGRDRTDTANQPLVSVIMPVYNSEAYVEAALRSLLDQDFDSFEVIAVDDGSTDASGAICDRIAEQDGRLRVIHKENGGICSARNTGLDHARGEYIMFCDNDDVALPGFISDNYALAKRYDADLVRFGRNLIRLDEDGSVLSASELSPKEKNILRNSEVLDNLDMLFAASSSVWTGLYRKSLIVSRNISFYRELDTGVEDRIFNDDVYRYAECVVLNPHPYYEWFRRYGHSTSLGFDDKAIAGFKKSFELESNLVCQASAHVKGSEAFARHMMHPLMDMLRSRAIGGKRNYRQERRIYKRFRDLYAPYFYQLKQMRLSVRARRSLWFLEKKFYFLFYLYGYFTDRRIRDNTEVRPQKGLPIT